MTEERIPPPIEWKDYYTVMAHFYRGELGRIMVWRQRLDTTTNWAIVSTTGIITYALGHSDVSHLTLFFAHVLSLILLIIEARRYRYYDAFRARVRMLEAHMIAPVTLMDSTLLQGNWKKQLSQDLLTPSFKISSLTAIYRRFRRNYIWIFGLLTGAWFVKVWAHLSPFYTLYDFRIAVENGQPLPPWLMWTGIVVLHVILIWLSLGGIFLKSYSGEFESSLKLDEAWKVGIRS
ncbi:MAG: DUF2270 domain-containing protein [Desulfobulbaceae bacterium]|nr:DUF2270 domain-containing protein [Desulfobulbaceae bacterium]